jgi:hypothetical protein
MKNHITTKIRASMIHIDHPPPAGAAAGAAVCKKVNMISI